MVGLCPSLYFVWWVGAHPSVWWVEAHPHFDQRPLHVCMLHGCIEKIAYVTYMDVLHMYRFDDGWHMGFQFHAVEDNSCTILTTPCIIPTVPLILWNTS